MLKNIKMFLSLTLGRLYINKQNDNTIFRFAGVQFSTKNRATARIVNMLMPVSNEINYVQFLKGELVV